MIGTYILPAVSGLLLLLACPPLDLYPLAWIGLIPFFFVIEQLSTQRGERTFLSAKTGFSGGFREGCAAGAIFNGGLLYWLALNSGAPAMLAMLTMVAAVVILALSWGMAAWFFVIMRRRLGMIAWLFVPFSWTAWEGWLSYLDDLAFPWALLGLTQAEFNPILQVMEFTGIWGVGFWVVALNVALFHLYRMIRFKRVKVTLIIGAIVILLVLTPIIADQHANEYIITEQLDPPTIRVMVVQGNIDPEDKWTSGTEFSWNIYDSLTMRGIASDIEPSDGPVQNNPVRIDLVVWPETALPTRIIRNSGFYYRISMLSDQTGAAILTGASDYRRIGEEYRPLNGAFLVKPNEGIVQRYAKQWLVPFGERVPFQRIFPYLGQLNFGQAEFLPGLRLTIFEVDLDGRVGSSARTGSFGQTARFPVLICYESLFPDQTRKAVQLGANLLVTISNDAWYGNSSELYQIAALSRFRCIETRRSMVRVSNTGISVMVDPLGRVIKRAKILEADWITADLPLWETTTFYVEHGNIFLIIGTIVYGIGLLWAAMKDKPVELDHPTQQPQRYIFSMDRGFEVGRNWRIFG